MNKTQMAGAAEYPEPIARLLTLGDTDGPERRNEWPDYVNRFGLTAADVPALLRMASDRKLYDAADDGQFWATIHAQRALGQLRAAEAIRPLLEFRQRFDEYNDYWHEDWRRICALVGPPALPILAEALADETAAEYLRTDAVEGLGGLAQAGPQVRDECVRVLIRALVRKEPKADALNGWTISTLVDLKAIEAAPVIEDAFRTEAVDETIIGDWDEVRFRLGLGPDPDPVRRARWERLARGEPDDFEDALSDLYSEPDDEDEELFPSLGHRALDEPSFDLLFPVVSDEEIARRQARPDPKKLLGKGKGKKRKKN